MQKTAPITDLQTLANNLDALLRLPIRRKTVLSQRLGMQHECSSSKSMVNRRNNLLLGQEV